MKYLLDVSSLIALGLVRHEFHDRVSHWIGLERSSSFLTCSITELGFVRIVSQAPGFGFSVAQARAVLLELRRAPAYHFEFIQDGNDIAGLPSWVNAPKQVTDGHLVELAKTHGAVLATLDNRIPGSYIIPA